MNLSPQSCLSVAVLAAISGLAAAQGPVLEEPVRFDGHAVVEVVTGDRAQLEAAIGASDHIWSEHVDVGPILLVADEAGRAALRGLGLDPRVVIENVQQLIDDERAEIERRRMLRDLTWFENYHPYDDIVAYLQDLAGDHPDLARTYVVGQSHQGRDIHAIEFTGPGDPTGRPVLFFNAAQHAREWASPTTVMYVANRFLELHGEDPQITDLMDKLIVRIVPVVNPDGYSYTWTNNRLWRKNRRDNGDGTRGVDLNRNWDINWGGEGSSGNTSSDIYRGPAPFSEPETQALRDDIAGDPRIVAYIDFHTYGQLILWPWGYTYDPPPEPDNSFFKAFSPMMADAIYDVHQHRYTPMQSIGLYPVSGGAKDWTYSSGVTGAWTFELRPDSNNPGFVLPPEEILPTAEENFAAVLLLAEWFSVPLRIDWVGEPVEQATDGEATELRVAIREIAQQVVPGSERMLVRADVAGDFVEFPLVDEGGGAYVGVVPALAAGRSFDVAFEVQASGGEYVRFPEDGAFAVEVVQEQVRFADDMEADRGWVVGHPDDTATTGIWNRMDPEPTAAQPGDDVTPGGVNCWVTDGRAGSGVGSFDVDNGGTTLTGPAMDASLPGNWRSARAYLEYWRWYSNDQGNAPNQDVMPVLLSTDGGDTWHGVEDVTENAGEWVFKRFAVDDIAAPGADTRLRFVARDDDPGSIVEAAVDEVRVVIRGVRFSPADLDRDGSVGAPDFFAFLDLFAAGDAGADLNLDGSVDAQDFFAYLDLFSAG